MADEDSAPRVEDASLPREDDGGEEGTERMELEETVTGSNRDNLPEVPSSQEEEREMTNSSVIVSARLSIWLRFRAR